MRTGRTAISNDQQFDRSNQSLRQAWTSVIQPDDYDAHMSAVGQAQANADLVATLFHERPLQPRAKILFAGAGTGQMFDFVSPDFLRPFHTTFTDINADYLKKVSARLATLPATQWETKLDDLEDSRLDPGFELVIAVLVLEHVDWRRAIHSISKLCAGRVFVVLQENPHGMENAMTPARPVLGSMQIFKQINSHLISPAEIQQEFAAHGFHLACVTTRGVLDGKKMIGQEFEK